MRDIDFSIGMVAVVVGCALAYLPWAWRHGRARHERADQDGGSVLLGRSVMEMAYWALRPVARALTALGLRPTAITLLALVPAALAGWSWAVGRWGQGAMFATAAAVGDILDGLVARETRTSSRAGALIDAAADRYAELFTIGGLAFGFRQDPALFVLALAALGGAFMVSYVSARADALGLAVPRGLMRRPERAVWLITGAGLTPFALAQAAHLHPPSRALREWPIVAAVTAVAVIANLSSLARLRALHRVASAREPCERHDAGDAVLLPDHRVNRVARR